MFTGITAGVLSVFFLFAAATDAGAADCMNTGNWFDADAHPASASQVITAAARADAVLLGETHIMENHHHWQLQVAAQVHAENPDMVLAFEAFPRSAGPVLDKWVAGELDEKQFLEQTGWNSFWRYDPGLYMGLFNFARINRIPMVGINVERRLIASTSANGWANVPVAEREGISDPTPATTAYRKMLEQSYAEHERGNKTAEETSKARERFIEAQLVWDRAFAQGIKTALDGGRAKGKNPVVVAVVGRGHSDYRLGVSPQLHSLGITNEVVLSPWDETRPCAELYKDGTAVADWVFATGKVTGAEETAKPRLGVFIEDGKSGVVVKDVAHGSVAEKAGIKPGDVITRAAGKRIRASARLVETVQGMAPGTWLPLEIRRERKSMALVAKFPAHPAGE